MNFVEKNIGYTNTISFVQLSVITLAITANLDRISVRPGEESRWMEINLQKIVLKKKNQQKNYSQYQKYEKWTLLKKNIHCTDML